ncbi:MAG TPA: NTP transferase domain-containing protein [Kiritimatiellia bacterium]|nr:NTP transferase domain-containing protein [Kiritimatiellia bacterium]
MNKPTLLILAAGMGSRYGGLKQLDPVGPSGEIVLDYSIYDALRAGFGRVVFVIRREMEAAFREQVGAKWEPCVPCVYVFQDLHDVPAGFSVPPDRAKPWGTAHAIRAGRHVIAEPFAAINADDFYGADSFRKLADFLSKPDCPHAHCMVAFRLGQTLSEHGSVSRGVCLRGADGLLTGIREHTKISRHADGTLWDEPPGGEAIALTGEEPVSMNCWGFKPLLFEELERSFAEFLRGVGDEAARTEFTIPAVVDGLIRAKRGTVAVLETSSRWFGVTYREDKAAVQKSIQALVASGEYPAQLK